MSHESTLTRLLEHLEMLNGIIEQYIGHGEHYTPDELLILQEYLTLSEVCEEDRMFLIACAQEAIETLSQKTQSSLQLSQFGARETGLNPETQSLGRAVDLNRAFLHLWKATRESYQAINLKRTEVRKKLEGFLERASGLQALPNSIASLLEQDGFTLVDENCKKTSTEELLTKGVVLISRNGHGHEREVRILPNGQFYIHAQINEDLTACKKEEETLTMKVLELIEQESKASGMPLKLRVKQSGIGRNLLTRATNELQNQQGASLPHQDPDSLHT